MAVTFDAEGFVYHPCQAGGGQLECTFASVSTGNNCTLVIIGQGGVRVQHNGTVGFKTVALSVVEGL